MSFILDALKKSETDRQEQGSADFADVPTGDESRGAPRWLWALAFLLAINLAVLLGLLLRDDAPEVLVLLGQLHGGSYWTAAGVWTGVGGRSVLPWAWLFQMMQVTILGFEADSLCMAPPAVRA